ncbi:hypothetical protein J1C56_31435 [Aminobacter anthyllidis]|uniref:Uncharacterized protein n=1 Tax=Aminobacter anthyllidis TaxID=1035067 RepID=A0A9X1AHG2_9HYPH|nr:hypothetical protein [Aminobacter anthyllidis]
MDKIVARHVIARVEAVEIAPHPPQFLFPIGGKRFLGLVASAARPFGSNPPGKIGRGREFGGSAEQFPGFCCKFLLN